MGMGRTLLLPVHKGKFWRVQIAWPNGSLHYFGKFTSKRDALAWITAHSWLTAPTSETPIRQASCRPTKSEGVPAKGA
jgi:hypothetical protein